MTANTASLLDSLGSLGVTKAFISVGAPGVFFGDLGRARELALALNEYAARLIRLQAARIGAFATVALPDTAAVIDETAYAMDHLGLDGVCLLSNYAGVRPGDPALDEYLACLNERSAIVLLHPALPPGPAGAAALAPRTPIPTQTLQAIESGNAVRLFQYRQ